MLKLHEQLLYILSPLVREDNKNLETRRMAINCLGNLCYRTGNKFQGKYKNVYNLLLANLNSPNPSDDEAAYLKVFIKIDFTCFFIKHFFFMLI